MISAAMKSTLFLIVILMGSELAFGSDSLSQNRKNTFYLMPSSIGGDMWFDLNQTWLELGYTKQISNTQFIGVRVGNIIHSKSTSTGLLNDISSGKSTGFNFNLEHKILLRKKLYYSSNFFFQETSTNRKEMIDKGELYLQSNTYLVKRNVYAFIPKIGFVFLNKRHFYLDIGAGIGAQLISSKASNKFNINSNLERENISGKVFDSGQKIAGRFTLQIQLGYSF
jgi:hypothetical protein